MAKMFGDSASNIIKPKSEAESSFSENLQKLNEISNQDKLYLQFTNDNAKDFSDSTNDFMVSVGAIDTDVYAAQAYKAPKNGAEPSFGETLSAFNTNQRKLENVIGNQDLVQFANSDPAAYSDEQNDFMIKTLGGHDYAGSRDASQYGFGEALDKLNSIEENGYVQMVDPAILGQVNKNSEAISSQLIEDLEHKGKVDPMDNEKATFSELLGQFNSAN